MVDSKMRVVIFLIALLGGVAVALASTESYAAALQLMAPSTTMGFQVRRRVLSNVVRSSSLDPNKAACLSSCPAAGGAYTGRGCQKVYQCSG
jgi:hypothetical protein